jgi:solute carrier family 36 (proton-coupled amino acid transporter)
LAGYAAVGKWGQVAVDVSLVLSQAGFGCVYVVFIARNGWELLNTYGNLGLGVEWQRYIIALEFFIFVPLTWVRRLAKFGYSNLLADAIILFGLTGIMAYSIQGMVNSPNALEIQLFNPSKFSLFLGRCDMG